MKAVTLIIGLILLILLEVLRVYFIMPFPGSQSANTIGIAYWLHNNILWLRLIGWAIIAYPLFYFLRQPSSWKRYALLLGLVLYAVVGYLFNFRFLADKMFYQPKQKMFATGDKNSIKGEKLVIGVSINGEAKAYPIQLIGYHHQVRDTVGGIPVMVTYCTVCRTGRVFSPDVKGKTEDFRLVGMDHFNAMFEDASTKSWWQQATGMAIAGPLKGTSLKEIPSQQVRLDRWLEAYPTSLVMQPDDNFKEDYAHLDKYDKGQGKSDLTRRDTSSWQFKSWVVGISTPSAAKAYDWNRLIREKVVNDSLPGLATVLLMETDSASFHAWDRKIDSLYLRFQPAGTNQMSDTQTGSVWNADGKCVDGFLKGKQLARIQAYQEFWHSWQTFHPHSGKY
ncbi:DUF3179 domain-containing protein [Flavihumibacter rivuli]|uniref:DUF3179 domain-containing (seleno)protein n=1 Tax=Flavihumibacter rivuli TaxID=2838156 RepID=UPI001BDE5475|nr:DUF3179 domain-containing (seleno)protein [Flavihumibacter rivuli]ULQ55805.1 DUF3179 domain-containing protein [Flavihumibacter rivuli]